MIMPILMVKDVDASVKFYSEKLGLSADPSVPGPDGKTMMGFVRLGQENPIGFGAGEVEHAGAGVSFMIYVPDDMDIDQLYNEINGRGVKIETPLKTEYWGDRIFSLHDPDGYALTFAKTVKQMTMDEIQAAMPQQES